MPLNPIDKLDHLKSNGGKIIGCFPLYPPLALFYALDLVPVVLWGLRADIRETPASDRHLQNYSCAVARHMTELLLSEAGDRFDGLFMYNACDTLRNLPEIIENHHLEKGRSMPLFRIHVPMVPPEQTDASHYLKNEINRLVRELEDRFAVGFSPEKFVEGIHLYRRLGALFQTAQQQAASGALMFTDLVDAAVGGAFAPVQDRVDRLETLISGASGHQPENGGPHAGVVISGILPPPVSVLSSIHAAGLRVVGNDIAFLHRAHADLPGPDPDPAEYYDNFYRRHYPCSTLLYAADQRVDALIRRVRESGAAGVVFIGEKFCEYEYFEFPFLEKKLKEDGIFTLQLEIAMDDDAHTGAHDARIRAFGEILNRR